MEHEYTADEQLSQGQPGSTAVVRWLIVINAAVFFLQLTLVSATDVQGLFGFATGDLDSWWTVGTYMFVHAGVWPLALNMYALWLFGSRLEASWGSAQFGWYYLLCGLGGWFFHLLFVRTGLLIGASGAIMGVAYAYATQWPNERMMFLGLVPIAGRWLAALLVLAIIAAGVSGHPGGDPGSLAQLGGIATGWMYLRTVGLMNIERLRRHIAPIAEEPEDAPPRAIPPRSVPRRRSGQDTRDVDEIVQQSQAAIAERTANAALRDPRHLSAAGFSSAELNALLDKISAHGLDALTQPERDRLEDAARRLRDR